MARMIITKGLNAGVAYELGERSRIGRLGENEIQVPDPNVSRIHAEIIRDSSSFTIFDRGSKNGILINGQEIAEKSLQTGDEIVIGGSTFVFDPEFDIQNARFSNNAVVLFDPGENTPLSTPVTLTDYNPSQDSLAHSLSGLSDLFGGSVLPLADRTRKIAEGIQKQFSASGVALLIKEHEDSPLMPLIITPDDMTLCINRTLITSSLQDKASISAFEIVEPGITAHISCSSILDENTGKSSVAGGQQALMIVPMVSDDKVVGAIAVVRMGDTAFTQDQLAMLKMFADLSCQVIEASKLIERMQYSQPQAITLDAEQRSASTRSLRMQEIYNSAKRSADGAGTVLITGESGTGKETLAGFIHENGNRASGPFVVVNCANIPADQFERQFFGYEKDAFEGADSLGTGKVEEAQGGTLFLYEVSELDLTVQPKLLRFIQDRAFYREGGKRAIQSDIRIIASATSDLATAVRAGKFREDLWYRLNVVPFHMPPLRERREDIAPLLDFFINRYASLLGKKVIGANDSVISLLQKYDWPGNIRELSNTVERAVMLTESKVLSTSDFSYIEDARRRLNSQADLERKRDTKPLAEVERQHIIIALKKHNFNQARAAEALGLHRNTLRNKIIEYGIEITK